MKYTGFVIADIHIGAMPIEKLYKEFTNQFIHTLKKEKHIDYIIIAGDYFDGRLYLNEKESSYAYIMLQDIINTCQEDTKIRFVYGTESHECNQYNIISKTNVDRDIRVIKYVEEEELFPDFNVLYLPEEYIIDKDEYYREYFQQDKKYNYIFGHGIIREAMKQAAVQVENKTGKRKKVPVFSTAELHKICKGQTFFGHYHVNTDMDDVFYVGSFSRWIFGEDEPKGFYKIIYNDKKEEYQAEFLENTECDIYKTISFGYKSNVFKNQESMENELNKIDNLIKSKVFDHVRFEFNIPEDIENPEFIINYLKERYKFNNIVKLNIIHGYIAKKREIEKQEIKHENDKYAFIFDKSMKIEDQTSYFIEIEYQRKISSERIDIYIHSPLNEIIEKVPQITEIPE